MKLSRANDHKLRERNCRDARAHRLTSQSHMQSLEVQGQGQLSKLGSCKRFIVAIFKKAMLMLWLSTMLI